MKFYILAILITVTACIPRPQRPKYSDNSASTTGAAAKPGQNPTAQVGPVVVEVDLNIANNTYISIGSSLQKELDTGEGSKAVKVYVQIRQENNILMNLEDLKDAIGSAHQSIGEAVDNAKKSGASTVEFTIDIATLKASLPLLKNGVSAMEVSLLPAT